MKMAIKNTRRIAAMALILALLCGLLVGTVGTVSAAEQVQVFAADFGALKDLVPQNGFENGVYVSTAEDTAINEWMDARFGMFFASESYLYSQRSYLGEGKLNNGGDKTYTMRITESGYVQNFINAGDWYMLRSANAFTIKAGEEYAVLKNFEATLRFNEDTPLTTDEGGDTNHWGAVFISFNEETPGKVGVQQGADTSWNNHNAVYLGYGYGEGRVDGVLYQPYGKALSPGKLAENDAANIAYCDLADSTEYTLTVRVVNGVAQVIVKAVETDYLVYSGSFVSGNRSGYLSVGATNGLRLLKSVTVTELDENGEPIDFGTYEETEAAPAKGFSADFGELSTLVPAGSFADGEYASTAQDTAINEWVDARFGTYFLNESQNYAEKTYLGEGKTYWDGIVNTWEITENGYLKNEVSRGHWYMLNCCNALTVKADGKLVTLKNFEASLCFNVGVAASADENGADNKDWGAVFVSFQEQFPGKVGVPASTDKSYFEHSAVYLGYGYSEGRQEKIVYQPYGVALDQTAANYNKYIADCDLAENTDYILTVKVVNGVADIAVKSVDGTVLYGYSFLCGNRSGYLSFGATDGVRYFKSVTVNELDETGAPVDFGTFATKEESSVNRFTADFGELKDLVPANGFENGVYVSKADDTAINEWMDARFGAFFTTDSSSYSQRAYLGESKLNNMAERSYTWRITESGYLQNYSSAGHWYMLHSLNSLTVKAGKDYAKLKNFEVTLRFNEDTPLTTDEGGDTNHWGAVFVSFHEQTPGRLGTQKVSDKRFFEHSAVYLGYGYGEGRQDGIVYQPYGKAINAGTVTANTDVYTAACELEDSTEYTLTVKVVNGVADISVKETDTGVAVYSGSVACDDKAGYLSVGATNGLRLLKSVTVTELDENGEPMDFQKQEDNTVKVSGNTLTVKAGEGYQLKAGSLIVTDAKGEKFVPTRVDFRQGGDASEYTIPTDAVAPFEVDYEFVQPGDTDGYNAGFIGASVNPEKSGLRFVNRFYIDENGMMLFGGEKVAVKEYGILVAASSVLANASDLDIATAEDSIYIPRIKWGCDGGSNKFFDKCADYVDVSVQIVGIPEGAARELDFHTRAYIVLENDAVVYMDPQTENYADVVGGEPYQTERLVDLLVDDRMKTIGRYTLEQDKLVTMYNNVTVAFSGELQDSVVMRMANTGGDDCIVHVIVDDNVEQKQKIMIPGNTEKDVVLCTGLEKGNHTIEVIRGTCTDWKYLELYDLTYKGTLTTPTERELKIEFLGDSITCANGSIKANGVYDYGPLWQDGFYSYAAITGRALNADTSVLSVSGINSAQMYTQFTYDNWDFAAHPQDIVVINLGTNDVVQGMSDEAIASACETLLTAVREAYGADTYIVWAYGMMTDDKVENYQAAVDAFNDDRVLFCDLTSVKNNLGGGMHPDEQGQEDAAAVLTAFLQQNCL